MDIFDEFEMKPLTKGLGFHKKVNDLKSEKEKASLGRVKTQHAIPELPADEMFDEDGPEGPSMSYDDILRALDEPSRGFEISKTLETSRENGSPQNQKDPLNFYSNKTNHSENNSISQLAKSSFSAGLDFFEPEIDPSLPFPGEEEMPLKTPEPTPPSTHIPALNKNIHNKGQYQIQKDSAISRGASNSPVGLLRPAAFSLSSSILDVFVVLGISMISMALLVIVTEIQLDSVFRMSKSDFTIQIALVIMYVSIYQIYVIGSRAMTGKTLGEWTFGFQLGKNQEQEKAMYPMKVLLRAFMTVATGIIILPLLSLLFQVDLLKYLSGLQLYRQNDYL